MKVKNRGLFHLCGIACDKIVNFKKNEKKNGFILHYLEPVLPEPFIVQCSLYK